MSDYFLHILAYLFARYIHIVCATVLVGGTLFYEMVVPPAIDELKTEQQLLIFARARWFFKWIVWLCAFLIVVSGVISSYGHWREYNRDESAPIVANSKFQPPVNAEPLAKPGWWWAAHASCGILSVIISVGLTIGKVPPSQPIRWMRLNLIILLLVMFLATATRQTRLEASAPTGVGSLSEPAEPGPHSMTPDPDPLLPESDYDLAPGVRVSPAGLRLQYSRAGGPGGQNVNKVNTKAEAWISLNQLTGLSPAAMTRLITLVGRRLTITGELHIVSVVHRTQERNRQEIFDRLRDLLIEAQKAPKPRKKTRPSAGSRKRRLETKRRRSEIKKGRTGKEW